MPEPTRLTRHQFITQKREEIAKNLDIDSVLTLDERDELIIEAFNELPEGYVYDPEPAESWVARLNRQQDDAEKHSVEKILKSSALGQQALLTMHDPLAWAWVTLGSGQGHRKPLWFLTAFDLEAWVQRKRDAAERASQASLRAEETKSGLSLTLARHPYYGAAMDAGEFSYAIEEEQAAS